MVYNRSIRHKGREDESTIEVVRQAAGSLLILFFVIGILFNSLALYTFRRCRNLHTPCNFLAVGHILTDVLVVLLCIPFEIASNFYGMWLFGPAWCQGYGFMVTLLWVTSVCIYTAIAMDRYLVVTRANIVRKITMFKACMTILSCFGYGLMWAAFPLVGWGNYMVDAAGTSCDLEWDDEVESQYSYGVTLLVLVLIFPLSSMAFCYVRFMMQVSINAGNSVIPTDSSVTLQTQAIRSKEVQVAYAAFIAICSFVLGMAPYWIAAVLSIFNSQYSVNPLVAIAIPVFAKSTSVSGPILYVLRNRDYREAFKRTVLRRCMAETGTIET